MPNPRLLAVVTALIMAASAPAAQATYSLTDLQTIEQLVVNRNWNALRAYIDAHPELLDGNDPLAVELRTYVESYNQGFFTRLFTTPQAPGLDLIQQLVAQY